MHTLFLNPAMQDKINSTMSNLVTMPEPVSKLGANHPGQLVDSFLVAGNPNSVEVNMFCRMPTVNGIPTSPVKVVFNQVGTWKSGAVSIPELEFNLTLDVGPEDATVTYEYCFVQFTISNETLPNPLDWPAGPFALGLQTWWDTFGGGKRGAKSISIPTTKDTKPAPSDET